MFKNIPWQILWQPRTAIQEILQSQPKPSMLLPCIIGICSQAALIISFFGGQVALTPWVTLLTMFIVAIFFFVVHLQLATIFFDMVANAMGGKEDHEGKAQNVFTAYCWSYLAEIIYVPLLALSVLGILTQSNVGAFIPPILIALIGFALTLWRMAIFAVCYSKVKALSLVKAALIVAIAFIFVNGLLIIAPTAFITG